MKYTVSHIAAIIDAIPTTDNETVIDHLLLDSRKIYSPASSLFFAIRGPRRNGHQFIPELYKKGIRNFVISDKIDYSFYPGADFLFVDDTVNALQALAAFHRRQFTIPVIGITGSNGKTMVKEWLYQLLQDDYNIVRSPRSYNSQTGVPLSIWQMNEQHTLGIFEAGISEQEEMLRLEKIIRPTTGILTNIGEAHSEGFIDAGHKFREKLVLFKNCKTLIGRDIDFEERSEYVELLSEELEIKTWGSLEKNDFRILTVEKREGNTVISLSYLSQDYSFLIPFTDDAAIENAISCCCMMLQLSIDGAAIANRMQKLQPVNMRLERKKGINNSVIINDSYSADLSSLEIALNFLNQQSGGIGKTAILSDFLQSAQPDEELYPQIWARLKKHHVLRLIAIGSRITANLPLEADFRVESYLSTADFKQQFRSSQFKEEAILIKGARIFAFEEIAQLLEQKTHQTLLEINLHAIGHNLKEYQKLLKPATKVMAMVKAFAYGSGGAEIAGILQYHKVDYLGVAYADEGVELRKAGITLPIMVMNPDENAFELIVENDLEPEIYSFALLHAFDKFLKQESLQSYPVHIEIETGMNRLGFGVNEVEELSAALQTAAFSVQTVFSHLAASEEMSQDEFTMHQFSLFKKAAKQLQEKTAYPFITHIANSAAVARHPGLQMDMVRLGIGLYGVDGSGTATLNLQTVATLKSTVAQLKHLKAGESVSYNRKGVMNRDSVIATIRIGYADGYPRRLGNGIGKIWVKGKQAPIVGTVCMDMFMVDVTNIADVEEGDEVVIFGNELPVQQLAEWAATIPYEIMTGISQRVKRVYFDE